MVENAAENGDEDIQPGQLVELEFVEEHGPGDGLQDVVGEEDKEEVEEHWQDPAELTGPDIEKVPPEGTEFLHDVGI